MLVYYILKTLIIFDLFSKFGKNLIKIKSMMSLRRVVFFYEEFQDNKDVCILIWNGVIDIAFRNMLNLGEDLFLIFKGEYYWR
jgi:hypothetical protein